MVSGRTSSSSSDDFVVSAAISDEEGHMKVMTPDLSVPNANLSDAVECLLDRNNEVIVSQDEGEGGEMGVEGGERQGGRTTNDVRICGHDVVSDFYYYHNSKNKEYEDDGYLGNPSQTNNDDDSDSNGSTISARKDYHGSKEKFGVRVGVVGVANLTTNLSQLASVDSSATVTADAVSSASATTTTRSTTKISNVNNSVLHVARQDSSTGTAPKVAVPAAVENEYDASMFSDDDDANSLFSASQELSWRLHPIRSLSDWTVQIVVVDKLQQAEVKSKKVVEEKEYHVHKSVLAVGPRGSSFFKRAFNDNNQKRLAKTFDEVQQGNEQAVADDCAQIATLAEEIEADPSASVTIFQAKTQSPTRKDIQAKAPSPTPTDESMTLPATTSYASDKKDNAEEESGAVAVTTGASDLVVAASSAHETPKKQNSEQLRSSLSESPCRSSSWSETMKEVGDGSSGASSLPWNITRIEMHPLAGVAFPVVLDYMYSSTGALAITTHNAAALHSLSMWLDIRTLRRKVRQFWMRDLNMDNMVVYYRHARIFDDIKIVTHAERYCASHLFEICETTVMDILSTVDPIFYHHVLSEFAVSGTTPAGVTCDGLPRNEYDYHVDGEEDEDERYGTQYGDHGQPRRQQTKDVSLRLSLLTAVYCNIHKEELTPLMFTKLTDATHLPHLEMKAAKAFLELEDEICGRDPSLASSLKVRCIDVLSKLWNQACCSGIDSNMEPNDVLRGVSADSCQDHAERQDVKLPRLFGEALESFTARSFLYAKDQIDQLTYQQDKLRRQNEILEKALQKSKKEVDRLNYRIHLEQQQKLKQQSKASSSSTPSSSFPLPQQSVSATTQMMASMMYKTANKSLSGIWSKE